MGSLKLTDAAIQTYLDARRLGTPKKYAAAVAGIGKSTLHQYEQRAELARQKLEAGQKLTPTEKRYVDFVAACDAAHGETLRNALAGVCAAVPRDWRAGAWLATKLDPEEFGDRQAVEVGGAGGGPIAFEVGAAQLLDQLRTMRQNDEESDARVVELKAAEG